MKPIKKPVLKVALIMALCFLGQALRAQFVQTMNIQVTAQVQLTTVTNRGYIIDRTRVIRLTTRDILNMIAVATSNDFTGATLVTVDYGAAFQVRRGGVILADVSDFFGQEPSDAVFDAIFDTYTGRDSSRGRWVRKFVFGDGLGNHIELTGLVEERYSASSIDFNGDQRFTDTAFFTGVGTGTLADDFAIFKGSVSTWGRGIRQP